MLATAAVTYQTETLSDALWAELMPLLADHWREVAHDATVPLDPVRDQYGHIQSIGMLRVYTARRDGALIGYLGVFVAPSLHSHGLSLGNSDAIYVRPSERGLIGPELIRHVVADLRGSGVHSFYMHVKHRPSLNAGALLCRLGFEHVDDVWSITLAA